MLVARLTRISYPGTAFLHGLPRLSFSVEAMIRGADMASRPWFPFYPSDYLSDTPDLDAAEHGVYLLLLSHSWARGPLPDDMPRLRRLAAGASDTTVRTILDRYWELSAAGWANPRLERERKTGEAKYQAKAGRIAQARAHRLHGSNQSCNQACNQPSLQAEKVDLHVARQPQPQPQQLREQIPSLSTKVDSLGVDDGSSTPPESSATRPKEPPVQAIVELYHELCCPPMARIYKLTEARRSAIRARWADDLTDLDDWRAYLETARQSRFLCGDNDRGWRADLAWLVRADNFAKVAEGKYTRA